MRNPVFLSLDIIEDRIMERLTIDNIADSVFSSKYYYQRLFREIMGDSVMSYVTKRKLTLAGKELLETSASILDVALKYGYDSHEGFTRSFKAYMGITPSEYRKYHLSAIHQKISAKGRNTMMYSKVTDGIIRELNGLIVLTRETAEFTRKNKTAKTEAAEFYSQFWDFIANKADAMADKLMKSLARITAIADNPDEITARFGILKAMEETAFWGNITAFNAGLMIARAKPEHQEVYKPICKKYYELAGAAHMKTGIIAEFFSELAVLIFDDMRKTAMQLIDAAIKEGEIAAEKLTDYAYYDYIRYEIAALTKQLSSMPVEDITAGQLEDFLLRLEIISFAADTDSFRMPPHKELFDGLALFKTRLEEAAEFFRTVPKDIEYAPDKPKKGFGELAFQGNLLLFYIRGEVQKMGDFGKAASFDDIYAGLNKAIRITQNAADDSVLNETKTILETVYEAMELQADRLGEHGGTIKYLAKEVKLYAGRVGNVKK